MTLCQVDSGKLIAEENLPSLSINSSPALIMTDGQQQYVGGVCGPCIVPVIIMAEDAAPQHKSNDEWAKKWTKDEASEPEK